MISRIIKSPRDKISFLSSRDSIFHIFIIESDVENSFGTSQISIKTQISMKIIFMEALESFKITLRFEIIIFSVLVIKVTTKKVNTQKAKKSAENE